MTSTMDSIVGSVAVIRSPDDRATRCLAKLSCKSISTESPREILFEQHQSCLLLSGERGIIHPLISKSIEPWFSKYLEVL